MTAAKKTAEPARRKADAIEERDDAPTPEQAKEMFKERPDCAAIVTTEGRMRRDGTME